VTAAGSLERRFPQAEIDRRFDALFDGLACSWSALLIGFSRPTVSWRGHGGTTAVARRWFSWGLMPIRLDGAAQMGLRFDPVLPQRHAWENRIVRGTAGDWA
jgi:hypothetical protein